MLFTHTICSVVKNMCHGRSVTPTSPHEIYLSSHWLLSETIPAEIHSPFTDTLKLCLCGCEEHVSREVSNTNLTTRDLPLLIDYWVKSSLLRFTYSLQIHLGFFYLFNTASCTLCIQCLLWQINEWLYRWNTHILLYNNFSMVFG